MRHCFIILAILFGFLGIAGAARAQSMTPTTTELDLDMRNRHVVVVADGPDHRDDLRSLKPFIKEYAPILVGVGRGADTLARCGYRPDLIVGDPEEISAVLVAVALILCVTEMVLAWKFVSPT